MKVVLWCAVFIAVYTLASAENCRSATDCLHVTCPEPDYKIKCLKGECICKRVSQSCVQDTDCTGAECRYGWQCSNFKCRCGQDIDSGIE